MSFDELQLYINEHYNEYPWNNIQMYDNWVSNHLETQIQEIAKHVFLAARIASKRYRNPIQELKTLS